MAPEIGFTTERPKLPAAFLKPQTCPTGRCRFPGTPLPPASPVILAAITKSFFGQLRRQMAPGCFVLIEQQLWEHSIAGARILELARAGFSPDQIIVQVESQAERIRTGESILKSFATDKDLNVEVLGIIHDLPYGAIAGSSDFTRMDIARMMNGREYEIVVNGEVELLCLHDVLDPQNIEEWTALLDVHQIFPLSERAPKLAEKDREPLLRRLNAELSMGAIGGAGWEVLAVWRGKIKTASDAFYRILGESTMELFIQNRFCGMMYDAITELGSSLPLFAHLLFRPSVDRDAMFAFIRSSSEIRQFVHFSTRMFIPSLPFAAADFHELDEFLPKPIVPPSPMDISLPPPSPVAPDTTFRRTKMVKNDSEFFWWIHKRVEPRCCAPDRCSGRTPATINDPAAPDYARVESAINSIFIDGCFLQIIAETSVNYGPICEYFLEAALRYDCETPEQELQIVDVIEAVVKLVCESENMQRDSGVAFVEGGLQRFHELLKSTYRRATGENRFPCLCDLVNNVDAVEALAEERRRVLKSTREQPVVANRLTAMIPTMERWITTNVDSGVLKQSFWKGEGWKQKVLPLYRIIDRTLDSCMCMCGPGEREKNCERYRQLFGVMGSARIMSEAIEVAARFEQDESVEFFSDIVEMSYLPGFDERERMNQEKVGGDDLFCQRIFVGAILKYKASTFFKPIGSWGALVNSAAVRLRMATGSARYHYHYSMAIQDCTMALYYCPPKFKFKAYYRRGFALARLQLWKKAILDFEQALLIEPQNVLIKQELAAAKRMLRR